MGIAVLGCVLVAAAVVAAEWQGESLGATPSASFDTLPVRWAQSAEPDMGLIVTLTPTRRIGKPGAGGAELEIAVVPELGAVTVAVELQATGRVQLRSDPTRVFDVPSNGVLNPIPVDYIVAGGEGSVVVVVTARDTNGTALATEQAELFLLESDDEVLSGTAGVTTLRLEAFDRNEAPTLSPEVAADQRASLLDGVTLESSVEAQVMAQVTPGPDEVGVEGTIQWTDENGVQHPYRFAQVQIWEEDLFADDLITTVFTDATGQFGVVVDNDDGLLQGGRDIYVRARTVGNGFQVEELGGGIYSLRSPTQDDAEGGVTYVYTVTGTNTDDQGRAFAVHQSMALAVPYANRLNGTAFRHLDVVYPNGDTFSFFDGTDLMIEGVDQYDWDTIHHEYGHFVAQEIGIENNPGGQHNLGDNLSETTGSKDIGTRLAWGEAWPTYFAISLQQEENAAALGVPRVGDTRYQAFETAPTGIDYSMETSNGGGVPGEDNEVAVQRVLWDLYDANDDAGDTDVALGDGVIWQRLDGADPITMSAGWQAVTGPMTVGDQANAGCIISNWGIAPNPTAPANNAVFAASASAPAFQWDAGGGGPTYLNDEFVVTFWSVDYSTPLHTSPTLTTTSYTPNAAAWTSITQRRHVRWTVTGTQTDAPETGPYTGCGRALVVEQGPGSIFNLAGCLSNVLAGNDDGSTEVVPLGFSANFLGSTYTSAYVNNNGNLTFDSALSTYTPFPLMSTARVIVAPFFADVDTRNPQSGVVTYGQATFGGRPAFCVNWVDVGYYNSAVDKTNSFQLLLVDRASVSPGDFDIIFNFEKVEWETGSASGGSGGLGGSSARVGYASAGFDAFELQGSGVNGALLDSNATSGLIHGSLNSAQMGRYLFRVRNGAATGVAMSGLVTNEPGAAVAGAPVDVCAASGPCGSTTTNALGEYRIEPVPDGTYTVRVGAPAGTDYNTATVGPVNVAGVDVVVDVVLSEPTPPPAGTTITPVQTGGSVPVVYYNDSLDLTTTACAGGNATYTVTGDTGVLASGPMTENPAGTYTATIPPFFPDHGNAEVSISVDCPGGDPDVDIAFDIYIDPSGAVVDLQGNPVEGATVTLYRSDFEQGPFEAVPDGSAIMSPANRQNPMLTGPAGLFGWDTIAGYYVVRAEGPGCVDPIDESVAYVETPVLSVPPPQVGLELVLDCGEPPTPEGLLNALLDRLSAIEDAPPGIVVSLSTKVERALASLERGRTNAACGQLKAFVNQADALDGKWLDGVEASDFIALAEVARALLGCR
jgi:hypothetical protein